MTIDFWGLGLQAVNVLILMWLLSRVFWRPLAAAIANRQAQTRAMIEKAKDAQSKADTVLADVSQTRAGLEAERQSVLNAAKEAAEAASQATLEAAQAKAREIQATAKAAIAHDRTLAGQENEAEACDLAVEIAAKLLARLNGPAVQAQFRAQLLDALSQMSQVDRAALESAADPIEIVSAVDLGADQQPIRAQVSQAIGGTPELRFATDPKLIAGLELRSPHFVLHNSWQADLDAVRKALRHEG